VDLPRFDQIAFAVPPHDKLDLLGFATRVGDEPALIEGLGLPDSSTASAGSLLHLFSLAV